MGAESLAELRDVGRLLAALKEPEPPKGLKDAGKLLQMAKAVWDMKPAVQRRAPCQDVVREGDEVDLGELPVQTCWPGDAGPLITWGLVITRGPQCVARAAAAAEPGHLPPAGDRPARSHHALAGAPRRRARLPRIRARQPGPAVPDRGGAGRRPGHHPGRGDAGARHACPSTSSPACCAAAAPSWSTPAWARAGCMLQVPASAEIVLEGHIPPAPAGFEGFRSGRAAEGEGRLPARAGRPVRRPHRLLQRAGLVPGLPHRAA